MIRQIAVILVAISVMACHASAEGDVEAGKTIFTLCQTCHGMNGEGTPNLNAPRLAGQRPWYLKRQLRNLRAGIRGADPRDTFGLQMRAMALTLQDEQAIGNVVAYIQTFTPVPSPPTLDGDAEKGKKAFALCAACHGERGEGLEPFSSPRLAGQHDWYLKRQLDNFRADIRGNGPGDIYGHQMGAMARFISAEDVVNVIAYLNTLR